MPTGIITVFLLKSIIHLGMSAEDGSVFCSSVNGWLRSRRLAMWTSMARCSSSFDCAAFTKPSWYLAQSLCSSPTITCAWRLPAIFCNQATATLTFQCAMLKNMTTFIYASDFTQLTLHCHIIVTYKSDKKASIRWQDSARRQFQAGLIGDVGL